MNKEKLLLDYIRYQSEADTYVDALNDIFENMNKYLEENGEEQLNRIIDNLKISLENTEELAKDAYDKYMAFHSTDYNNAKEKLDKRDEAKKTLAFTYKQNNTDEYHN